MKFIEKLSVAMVLIIGITLIIVSAILNNTYSVFGIVMGSIIIAMTLILVLSINCFKEPISLDLVNDLENPRSSVSTQ